MKRTLLVVVAAAITAAFILAQLSTAKASGPAIDRASAPTASLYRNCKALNRIYRTASAGTELAITPAVRR